MHVDEVLLGVPQDVDKDLARRGDAVDRLVGVRGALHSAELCLDVDGDRIAWGVPVDVSIPDTEGWFGRLADPGDGDVITDRLGSWIYRQLRGAAAIGIATGRQLDGER